MKTVMTTNQERKQPINLKILQHELQQALDLINQKSTAGQSTTLVDTEGLNNTQSLLERCAEVVCQSDSSAKPILRVIHHFACSGGTIISKCIAAQPNVFLLSELHPTTTLGWDRKHASYTPRDIVTQAMYGRLPKVTELAEKIFVQSIIETEKHVRDLGGSLVIRSHSHADFCTDANIPKVDTLTRLLKPHFKLINLVTVRNPIDSFLSLQQMDWVHFTPNSFDEYCRRLLAFLEPFSEDQILKYEDFVERPETGLSAVADKLSIKATVDSFDYLDIFSISGDSGRKGSEILPRARKALSDRYIEEIEKSDHFNHIKDILQY